MKTFTYLSVCLLASCILITGCSDSDNGKDKEPIFEKTDMRILAFNELTPGGQSNGTIIDNEYHLYIVLQYRKDNNCQLSNETYASIKVYTDNNLRFANDYLDKSGYAHLTDETILLVPSSNPDYDFETDLYIIGSKKTTYEFALEFYQPQTGEYYITPRHRMRIFISETNPDWVLAETSIIE